MGAAYSSLGRMFVTISCALRGYRKFRQGMMGVGRKGRNGVQV